MTEPMDSSPIKEFPPAVSDFLSSGLERQSFIERAQDYLAELYQWLRANNHKLGSRRSIAQFTAAHDDLIQVAFEHITLQWQREHGPNVPNVAVLAVGGYGRGQLYLRSDIDLLVLMEQATREHEQIIKSLMHLLIDMRLNLGYATRTIGDCESTIGRDVDSTTAMIEHRLLAGARPLYEAFDQMIATNLGGRWRRWFLKSVYEQWRERHDKYEKTIYLLEPNLKEGKGGLRDVHTVYWTLFGLTGSTRLDQLREVAEFTEGDMALFTDAIDLLQTVRNEVHIASGAKNEQLLFAIQPVIAERLGFQAREHRSPEEVFMEQYYRHAQVIARYTDRAVRLLLRQEKSILGDLIGSMRRKRVDEGVYAQDDVMVIERAHFPKIATDTRQIMMVFEKAARLGFHLSDETMDFFTHLSHSLGPEFRLDPENNKRFLNILRSAKNAARTIRDMHDCGVLEKIMPEFAHINCMVRIDFYHHYTVDEHSIKTLAMAEELLHEPVDQRTTAGIVASEIKRWDLLNLALLLHDVGKGYGRGHALRGAPVAQRVGERLKLSAADIETVRWLVLSHLKLSHAAQRRDLSDPQVARQLAEEIGSLERLKLLYVHSVCDLKAVAPDAWNDWKDKLLAECYVRTAEVLGENHARLRQPAANLSVLRQKVLTAIRLETSADPATHDGPGLEPPPAEVLVEELDAFLKHTSDRYIQTSTPETIARHFLIRRTLDEHNAIGWRLIADTGTGFSELNVCAQDVPGLFHYICGALAAKDINIWSAQIFSTTDGIAINQFRVTDLENRPLAAGLRLDRLRQDLNLVIRGEKPIEQLIERHRTRSRKRPVIASPLPSRVLFDNDSSQAYTIIEVRASDRPGLLYRLTGALSECMLNIQRSIITTEAYGVVDVFYVTDLEFNKIHDAVQRRKIEQTILAALEV